MKVREIMTVEVGCCQPNANLTNAAMIMWQRDCGVVPVVDEQKKVVGMITDRDICIAVATKNRLASQIKIAELVSGKIKSCAPDDDVTDALKIMRKRQLRRLPVTNKENVLLGILSIGDIVRHAGKDKDLRKKLFVALKEISSFRPLQLQEIVSEKSAPHGENKDGENKKDKKETEKKSETAKDELPNEPVERANEDAASDVPALIEPETPTEIEPAPAASKQNAEPTAIEPQLPAIYVVEKESGELELAENIGQISQADGAAEETKS